MDAQGAAATFGKYGKIAAGLRSLHDTESVFLSGNRKILRIVASNLQENAAVGAAFVGLSGGVEETRAEAENRGDSFLVAHGLANGLQCFFIRGIHGDVTEDSKIIACTKAQKMS